MDQGAEGIGRILRCFGNNDSCISTMAMAVKFDSGTKWKNEISLASHWK